MKFYKLIILLTYLFGQTSSLNIESLGENRSFVDPGMTALGDSWYFSGQTNGLALNSVSTLWRSDLAQYSSSTSFSKVQAKHIFDQNSNHLNYLTINIPIGKQKTLGFSLVPKTRTGFSITDTKKDNNNIYFNGNFISTELKYHGKGGVSEFLISYSMGITNHFSAGIRWHIGFGNIFLIDTIITNILVPVDYNVFIYSKKFTDTFESKYQFNGNALHLSGLYTSKIFEFATSITIDQEMYILNERNYFTNRSIFTGTEFLSNTKNKYKTSINLRNFGLGITYKPRNDLGTTIEFHHSNDNIVPESLALFGNKVGKINSVNTGIYKWILNNRLGIWNTMILRAGMYGKRLTREGDYFYDAGVTLGFGVEYFNRTSNINFAIKFGIRTSDIPELNKEQYTEMIIGITSAEKWFIKRKRK